MQLRMRLALVGALLATGAVLGGEAPSLHPYPLYPFEPHPGRSGFGTPEIDSLLARYERTKGTDAAAAVLREISSESFFWGHPQFLPYPGSVEHVRHHLVRYLPPYPRYNHHTLARNFVLKDHPSTRERCVDHHEPVYYHTQWGRRIETSGRRGPFRVYPWRPGESLALDLGRLEPRMMYAIRVVGAVAEDVQRPLDVQHIFRLEINDRPDGRESTYILRGRASDNFYEVVNLMFHCIDDRELRARVTLLPESDGALLAYNVDVHNVFGECARRAGKKEATLSRGGPRAAPVEDADGRVRRDDALWHSLPPINIHFDNRGGRSVSGGFDFVRYGKDQDRPFRISKGETHYTWRDLAEHRELPGTGDRGYGVRRGDTIHSFTGYAAFQRYQAVGRRLAGLCEEYEGGNPQAGRDAAFLLARLVYQYPAVKPNNCLEFAAGGQPRHPLRRYGPGSDAPGGWSGFEPHQLARYYDRLFPLIEGNEELAAAVGRHVPWVRSSDDLRFLFDVYAVQYAANEILHWRFFYDHGTAEMLVGLAVIQNDNEISEPWMEFIFTRGWEYPQTIAGLVDNVVTNTTRDGASNIGSAFYATPAGLAAAKLTEDYIAHGGLARYALLADFERFPKSEAGRTFDRAITIAAGHNIGIGDVGGPSTRFGRVKTPDPSQRSRILPDWAAVLEGGTQHDDFRFRRAAAVTLAVGAGHAHADTLDLRMCAHGSIMSGDLGQRPNYGRPRHQRSYVHNVVEVDGTGTARGDWDGYAWIRSFFPAEGAQYLLAESSPPSSHPNVELFRRHVAMVNVDEGSGEDRSTDPSDPDVVTPSTYLVDMFRVSGGRRHTYCFHGCADEGFSINARNKRFLAEDGSSPEERYMSAFRYERYFRDEVSGMDRSRWAPQQEFDPDRDRQWAADPAGEVVQATWRLDRPCERRMLGGGGGAVTTPRKHMRLHLFDQSGARILHGIVVDKQDAAASCLTRRHTSGRCIFVQRDHDEEADAVFVALWEPYAGEPFIAGRRLLEVAGNESDARRATAVEVLTTDGQRHVTFTDGRPGSRRRVEGGITVASEYAFVGSDATGLRHVAMVGGDLLDAGRIRIEAPAREHRGRVVEIDLQRRRLRVRGLPGWKHLRGGHLECGNDEHLTTLQVSAVEPEEDGTVTLACREGLEIMRARVIAADRDAGIVTTNIAMLRRRGRDAGLVATGEDLEKRWRVRFLGGDRHEGFRFRLEGAPVTPADFPVMGRFSVWELGVGDTVSFKTGVSLRRTEPGVWSVQATAPFRVALGGDIEASTDGRTWKAVPTGELLGPGAGMPVRFSLRTRSGPGSSPLPATTRDGSG